jgi:hypothetical protein
VAIFTYTANKDPHDQTRILRLRDGGLVVEMGHAADFYPEEVAQLSSRVVLTPGASGPIAEPGPTEFIRLQDLLDVPRPLADNDVLAFDFGNGDFKAIQVATAAQLATKQDAATAATDAELTAHANTFGRGGHIPTTGLTTADVVFTIFDAKADLLVASAADAAARLGVGPDGQVLTADSTQPLGLKWATPDVTQTELDAVLAASVILAPTTTARNTVTPTAVGVIPLTLRQAVGEGTPTAVQQWLNPSGSMVAQVNGSGAFQGVYAHDRTISRPYIALELGAATIGAVARSATQVPWTLKAAASQTADIFQAQDSAGTALAYINSGGSILSTADLTGHVGSAGQASLTTPGGRPALYMGASPNRSQIVNVTTGVVAVRAADAVANTLVVSASGSQGTANIQEWQNAAFTVRSYVDPNGYGNFLRFQIGSGVPTTTTALLVSANSATDVPIAAKAFAAATADIFKGQDSSSTDLFRVTSLGSTVSAGSYQILTAGSSAANMILDNTGLSLGPGSATRDVQLTRTAAGVLQVLGIGGATSTTMVVKGIASQAGNLQEWQGSTGTALAFVSPSGRIGSGFSTGANGQIESRSTATTSIPFVARGFAGQTGDLQEWQDSAGTVLARFNSTGQLGIGIAPSYALHVDAGSTTNPAAHFRKSGTSGPVARFQDDTGDAWLAFRTGDVTAQWAQVAFENSAGAIKGSLDVRTDLGTIGLSANGSGLNHLFIDSTGLTTTKSQVAVATSATAVGQIVRGAASQTADLIQLQNSSSTVLSRFDSAGGLHIPTLQVGASTTAGWVLTADTSGNATWAPAAGGGGGAITLQDEGAALGTQRTTWNFIGAGVTAADDAANGRTNITIPGADVSTAVILAPATAGRNTIQPTDPTVEPLTVKGAAAQTADLLVARDSAGSALLRVRTSGGTVQTLTAIGRGVEVVAPVGADFSDTANQSFYARNNTGTSDALLTARTADTVVGTTKAQPLYLMTNSSARMTIASNGQVTAGGSQAVGVVPFVTKGVASQTADLLQVQNSAGSALSRFDSTGGLHAPALQVGTSTTAGNLLTADASGNATWTAPDRTPVVILAPTSSTRNIIQPTGAAFVPLAVRAFASQTANLQEWQNSAGTVLSRVAADGSNYIPATLSHTGTLLGFYNVTPAARAAARTMSNWTVGANALRTIDRNTYTPDQLFDFVMTMASDLQAVGLFA